jgi:hypothetical protein
MLQYMSPLLALSGHAARCLECRLLGGKADMLSAGQNVH